MTKIIKTDLLSLDEVLQEVPFKRSTLYRMVKNGNFPPPIKVGLRRAFWKINDIKKWYKDQNIEV